MKNYHQQYFKNVQKERGENWMVQVTELAAEKLKEIFLKEKNLENIMLRVDFGGFG